VVTVSYFDPDDADAVCAAVQVDDGHGGTTPGTFNYADGKKCMDGVTECVESSTGAS
jgi:hypothetical protein